MEFEMKSDTVKKLAHWESVTTEMLQDYPQMQSLIEDDLLYGLSYTLDDALLWADGSNDSITGLFNTSGVLEHTTVVNDQILDTIRRMITKIQVVGQGYYPSGIAVTPQVWEEMELLKTANDKQYLWVSVVEGGIPRVWRLPVAVTMALVNPDDATEHRILVGAFNRGAKIWDKETANIEVGMVNDQLIKNERTIVAEQRLAFAVKLPSAFKYAKVTISQ
jgi:HK97 family phage major capsid protein